MTIRHRIIAFAALGLGLVAALVTPRAEADLPPTLKIGILNSLTPGTSSTVTQNNLRDFIKGETGLPAEVASFDTWQEIADKLADKSLQVGVLLGHEYAWAQQRKAAIKPLALAVNGPTYPVLYVVAAEKSAVKELPALKGKAVSYAKNASYPRLYVESQAGGAKTSYFSKISTPDNSEDAIDDAIDGVVAAAVVERVSLDAFKRRKAGRFAKLQEVSHTTRLVPPVIAYAEGGLSDRTRMQFSEGLVNANKKDRGQTLLALFKLSGFEAVPADFEQVVAETLKVFPAPADGR